MLPDFKPAPPKFTKELAENSADDPEPAFLRQFIAGDRALQNRRRGELYAAYSIGVAVSLLITGVVGFVASKLLFVLCLVALLVAALATGGFSLWLLWDAKMADVESRALVAEGDFKIKVLSDEEVEKREFEKQRGIELRRKSA